MFALIKQELLLDTADVKVAIKSAVMFMHLHVGVHRGHHL